MDGGFSFPANAMRARDEINDALGMSQGAGMAQMGQSPLQMGAAPPSAPQMPPQMSAMRPQMTLPPLQMGAMQLKMPQIGGMQPQMPPQMPQMPPQMPQMGAAPGFKRGGSVKGEDFAVKREEYAAGGGAWTRKEGKNPEGGLNAKGRASLKAQGQDIKPPVSAKQGAKSPKAAARRKSFCARMSGMKGPMKDEGGKPTRKALALRKWDCKAQGGMVEGYAKGGKSRVNEAGNYTKPTMRKGLFNSIKAGGKGGAPGQWSARKAQMLAQQYKAKGGSYRD